MRLGTFPYRAASVAVRRLRLQCEKLITRCKGRVVTLFIFTHLQNVSKIHLSRKNGFLKDYDHINMLTHPDSPGDHFLLLVSRLRKRCEEHMS